MASSKKLTAVKKEPFNPQAAYQWQLTDQFALTGAQLDMLNKAFSAILNDPAAQKVVLALEGQKIVNTLIQEGYEKGLVKVYEPEPTPA